MNPIVRLVLMAAIAATALIGIVAIGLKAASGAFDTEFTTRSFLLPALFLFTPAGLAWELVRTSRRLADDRVRLADDHRRHVQGALVFWHLVFVGVIGWLAWLYVGDAAPQRDTGVRALVLLMGVAMAVRGNFVPKLSPPTGEAAPDPAAWTRTLRTLGWALTLTGAVLATAAFVLPLRPLMYLLLATGAGIVALSILQRRRLRPGSAA